MARVLVLGAAGGVGGFAARALATVDDVGTLVVADREEAAARALAAELDPESVRVVPLEVDVADPAALQAALDGVDLVVNCVGPFFRFGPPTLRAAIAAGVDYLDVCDDLDPTREMLRLDAAARDAGVRATIGMGNSPGVANVFVRLCAEGLLDQVETADIMHVHGGEPDEGAAVIHHRIHAMTNDVPLFVDGAFVAVRQLEDSGQAFVQEADFRDVGRLPVFPYPHPETITLPRHVAGLRRATNLGVITPLAYFRRTQELVRAAGPDGDLDEVVAQLQHERPGLLAEAGLTGPVGCLRVAVSGVKDGERHRFVFQLSSRSAGAGEGTGIPAAAGAALMLRGEAGAPGVLPPEAVVPPGPFLALAFDLLRRLGADRHGATSMVLEHTWPDGRVESFPLSPSA